MKNPVVVRDDGTVHITTIRPYHTVVAVDADVFTKLSVIFDELRVRRDGVITGFRPEDHVTQWIVSRFIALRLTPLPPDLSTLPDSSLVVKYRDGNRSNLLRRNLEVVTRSTLRSTSTTRPLPSTLPPTRRELRVEGEAGISRDLELLDLPEAPPVPSEGTFVHPLGRALGDESEGV